ncbi:ABC-type transport auxiliary lipoprotein family protein [Pararhizobium mangrovi]|uniref:ABC transporter n=1 Tax=Pararhizobium mangrovi TaxID=2590452 RepID=A0A506U8M3_9HYPH|nr:ABC-type transport auxiliary lipoprotein family protein [Pararhizobium mangrovi]TPW29315.1 ABC transporter [Pararhizobium mangrovi]
MRKRFCGLLAAAVGTMLLSGCASLPFGGSAPDTFDLSTPQVQQRGGRTRQQLLVPQPTALKALDGTNVVIRTAPLTIQFLAAAQWNDTLTNIVQAKLIEALENSGHFKGIGRPGDGLAIDYRVLVHVREFDVATYGAPVARVRLSVRLLNDRDGVVARESDFSASTPVTGEGNAAFIAALDNAFQKAVVKIVDWTIASTDASGPSGSRSSS